MEKIKGTAPSKSQSQRKSTNDSITPTVKKSNPLKAFRELYDLPAQTMIDTVREKYPKYDKTLQSKCEHGELYGICLKSDAMRLLVDRFGQQKKTIVDTHLMKNRVSCRLSDDDFANFERVKKECGFTTTQAFLTFIIQSFVREEVKKWEQ